MSDHGILSRISSRSFMIGSSSTTVDDNGSTDDASSSYFWVFPPIEPMELSSIGVGFGDEVVVAESRNAGASAMGIPFDLLVVTSGMNASTGRMWDNTIHHATAAK